MSYTQRCSQIWSYFSYILHLFVYYEIVLSFLYTKKIDINLHEEQLLQRNTRIQYERFHVALPFLDRKEMIQLLIEF